MHWERNQICQGSAIVQSRRKYIVDDLKIHWKLICSPNFDYFFTEIQIHFHILVIEFLQALKFVIWVCDKQSRLRRTESNCSRPGQQLNKCVKFSPTSVTICRIVQSLTNGSLLIERYRHFFTPVSVDPCVPIVLFKWGQTGIYFASYLRKGVGYRPVLSLVPMLSRFCDLINCFLLV